MYFYGWNLILVILVARKANSVVIDLSHGYQNQSTTCWNPTQRFEIFGVKRDESPRWYSTQSFSVSEHCGTHLDAPYHFYQDGWKLDDIPLERMIVEGVHLNVSHEVNGNGDFLLTVDHLKKWEHDNGPLPQRSVILVNFGWAHKFGNRQLYYNNDTERSLLSFPGLSKEAAQWIVDSKKVFGIGVDGPSVDAGRTTTSDVHKIVSKANIYNLENVAINGTTLPSKGFKLIIQPIKIIGGTGAPCRILAFTNNTLDK
ncbi:isatin hydrolase-like [Rhopalosiphum padi]|uniref:isatin hydrolase-like n=1 Tax=Rhopalosiphum padi TaxID=40932 RepID=UPI00298ECFBA|nr:isatin hydrolase-like [Rhopalosiphum padi]